MSATRNPDHKNGRDLNKNAPDSACSLPAKKTQAPFYQYHRLIFACFTG
jgi:hypothetical protein